MTRLRAALFWLSLSLGLLSSVLDVASVLFPPKPRTLQVVKVKFK